MANPFRRKASNEDGESFELPEAGLHPAVLVALVDLGTHHGEYQGNPTEKRSIFAAWELIGSKMKTENKPFVIGQEFNSSLHKKSNWRILLEGWRGRAFTQDEEFDCEKLLNAKCIVQIQIGLSKKDKKFAEVISVSTPFKGQTIPDATFTPFYWIIDMWGDYSIDPPIPEWMPRNYGRTLVDEIKDSDEWKASKSLKKWESIDKPAANGPVDQIMESLAPAGAMEREPAPF